VVLDELADDERRDISNGIGVCIMLSQRRHEKVGDARGKPRAPVV
jgi:hypothetical protein